MTQAPERGQGWYDLAHVAQDAFPMRASDNDMSPDLADALFGPMRDVGCFAVVDAAVVPNLPELIETSECVAQSLFSGQTAQELAANGPWLVALAPGDAFTRMLLTTSAAPWHLAGCGGFVLLRSTAGFKALRRHLRSVVSACDTTGRKLYFRFWQAPFLQVALTGVDHPTALRIAPPEIVRSALVPQAAGFRAISVAPGPRTADPAIRFVITDSLQHAFAQTAIEVFEHGLWARLVTGQGMDPALFHACLVRIAGAGFRNRAMVTDLMEMCHLARADVLATDWAGASLATTAAMAETSRWRALRVGARMRGLMVPPAASAD